MVEGAGGYIGPGWALVLIRTSMRPHVTSNWHSLSPSISSSETKYWKKFHGHEPERSLCSA